VTRSTAREHRQAIGLLVACGLFWSTGGVLIKLVDWHPLAIWSARSAIAAAALWLVRRTSLRGLTRAEWGAALALAATPGLFILSTQLTPAATAILIQYSPPVWIRPPAPRFPPRTPPRLDWVTIALVLGGITLFFFEQLTLDHIAGNLVALAAGVAFAFSGMTLRKVATTETPDGVPRDPLRPLLLGNVLGALAGLPFMFMAAPPSATGWLALAALGIVQQAAAYLCYARAIRHATALEAMLIPILEPVVSPIWVALAIGEVPGPWALVGGAIVVGAVAMRGVLGRRR